MPFFHTAPGKPVAMAYGHTSDRSAFAGRITRPSRPNVGNPPRSRFEVTSTRRQLCGPVDRFRISAQPPGVANWRGHNPYWTDLSSDVQRKIRRLAGDRKQHSTKRLLDEAAIVKRNWRRRKHVPATKQKDCMAEITAWAKSARDLIAYQFAE